MTNKNIFGPTSGFVNQCLQPIKIELSVTSFKALGPLLLTGFNFNPGQTKVRVRKPKNPICLPGGRFEINVAEIQ